MIISGSWDMISDGVEDTQISKVIKVKVKHLFLRTQVYKTTAEVFRYMARTKRRRTYLPYTFPAVASTHLPTQTGWRVE